MHNGLSGNEKCATLMKEARLRHDLSQQLMADLMAVTRQTVANWEKSKTAPTVPQVIEWFSILGESPLPSFLAYMYPDSEHTSGGCYHTAQNLTNRFKHCTHEGMEMLLFISSGDYGSSPHAVINLWSAYCHLPLSSRINLSGAILQQYELSQLYGNIALPECALPNIDCVVKARNKAIEAVKNGKSGY